MQMGFLMDGFNVTLKNMPVMYMPRLTPQLISVRHVNIQMKEKSSSQDQSQIFTLVIELHVDESIQNMLTSNQNGGMGMLKDDLQVFIGCSLCANHVWRGDFTFACDLPSLLFLNNSNANSDSSSKTAMCEQKVYNAILGHLNTHSKLDMLHFFLGNYEVTQASDFSLSNENLKLYTKTYLINNVDNFAKIGESLARITTSKEKSLVSNLLMLKQHVYGGESGDPAASLAANSSQANATNKVLLVASVIASFLVIVIVFTVVLVSIVFKMKREKASGKDSDAAQTQIISSTLLANSTR